MSRMLRRRRSAAGLQRGHVKARERARCVCARVRGATQPWRGRTGRWCGASTWRNSSETATKRWRVQDKVKAAAWLEPNGSAFRLAGWARARVPVRHNSLVVRAEPGSCVPRFGAGARPRAGRCTRAWVLGTPSPRHCWPEQRTIDGKEKGIAWPGSGRVRASPWEARPQYGRWWRSSPWRAKSGTPGLLRFG